MFTESDQQTRRWWPAEFRLVHRVVFSTELTMELFCTNTGKSDLRFEETLHTYNRGWDIANMRLRGLDTVHFLDNTNANAEEVQHGDVKKADAASRRFSSGDEMMIERMKRRSEWQQARNRI